MTDFSRIRRALGRHGRRLRPDGQTWCVFPDADRRRRPLVRIDQAMLARLVAAGVISADGSGGYRLTDEVSELSRTPIAGTELSSRRWGSGFAGLAARARDGLGPLTAAQVRAGMRYRADVELALSAGRVTMNWDFVRSDGPRCSSYGLAGGARARQRLRVLEQSVTASDLELIDLACVREQALVAIERRLGLAQRSAGGALSAALERVRCAYDGHIAPTETGDIGIG